MCPRRNAYRRREAAQHWSAAFGACAITLVALRGLSHLGQGIVPGSLNPTIGIMATSGITIAGFAMALNLILVRAQEFRQASSQNGM
jgi:hypothetical protein